MNNSSSSNPSQNIIWKIVNIRIEVLSTISSGILLQNSMNEKCCEDNFKKNQNYEISDSVDSHHLGSWSRWRSEGRQEERVCQDNHQAHPHCRTPEKRQSRWRFIFYAIAFVIFQLMNPWSNFVYFYAVWKCSKYNVLQTSSFWLLLQPSIMNIKWSLPYFCC